MGWCLGTPSFGSCLSDPGPLLDNKYCIFNTPFSIQENGQFNFLHTKLSFNLHNAAVVVQRTGGFRAPLVGCQELNGGDNVD